MKKLTALVVGLMLLFTGCTAVPDMTSSKNSSGESTAIDSIDSSLQEQESTVFEEVSSEESSTEDSQSEESSTEDSQLEESSTKDSQLEESSTEDSQLTDCANGHNYQAIITAPTCTYEGVVFYECDCGASYSEKIDALGHDYKGKVTAPTCTEKGYTTYTCSHCGDSYIGNEVSALGHSYKSVVVEPTCEAEGYTRYTCSACGDSYTGNEVGSLGHSYKGVVTAPTCTEKGYTTYTCGTCGDSYIANEVNALGHDWLAATTSAPKTCNTCGATEGEKLPSGTTTTISTLSVDYINVGQGDSIFIKVDDCDILIDGGVANQGTTVSNYLKSKNVDDVELMINTHPDADHCGGLTQVLKDFKVEEVWAPSRTATSATYKNFASAVSSEGLTAKKPSVGTIYTYEYLTLTVLYNGDGASNANDSSIVVMLQYASFRFLFTGDISSTIENSLASNSNINLRCDVLKVAHHGSKYSSTSSFLAATGARYGVICVGSNSYGHPTSTALNNLASAGISVYRTDTHGNVVFKTDGSTLTVPGGSTVNSNSSSSSGSSSSSSYDTFIGNKESKVFHLPTCGNLPDVSKRNYLYDYWFIVNCIGYRPCQVCLKNYTP